MPILLQLFLPIFLHFRVISSEIFHKPNVCPTFQDYYTIENNSNCWYDLAAVYTVPDIILLNGFEVVEYEILTKDGYLLTMFRIPNQNPHKHHYPVYLQHGLVATCANFLGLGQNSLAFQLAKSGFDVWLGNYRGTQYSEGHLNLTVYNNEYWEHSMDEIVQYDFPAMFQTIINSTGPNSRIIYIGHSLGTTLGLMYAAEFPEISEKIMEIMIFMSPAYTLSNIKSPYGAVAPFGNAIMDFVRNLKMLRIVSQAAPLRQNVRQFCLESPPLMQFCLQMYNLFYGPNTQMGPEIIPVYFNQLPGGTSIKVLNHAADLVMGNFRKYNYFSENFKRYGQITPPLYDIRKLRVPIYLIYSTQDWATTEADSLNLYRHIPDHLRFGIRKISLKKFNHMDFVFGRHVKDILYNDLIRLLNKLVDNK